MRFKLWLQLTEDLAGAGGGPMPQPDDQVALNRNIMSHGAGAFPSGGGDPPKSRKTAASAYGDSRFTRRSMRKK